MPGIITGISILSSMSGNEIEKWNCSIGGEAFSVAPNQPGARLNDEQLFGDINK